MQEDDLMSDFPFAFDPSPASSKLKRQCEHAANSDSSEDEFDLVNIPRTRPKGDVLGSTAGKRVESFCDASIGMTAEKYVEKNKIVGASSDVGHGTTSTNAKDLISVSDHAGSGEQVSNAVIPEVTKNTPRKPEHFSKYPHLVAQREERWNNLSADHLIWYQGFPALVVPPSMYMLVPNEASAKSGEVLKYGPCSKEERPNPDRRYVILQYLPLVIDHHGPSCQHAIARKCNVEKVLRYNARSGVEGKGKIGPPNAWADKTERFNALKNRNYKGLRRENFDLAMEWAQEFLDRALENDARKAKIKAELEEDALAEAARVAEAYKNEAMASAADTEKAEKAAIEEKASDNSCTTGEARPKAAEAEQQMGASSSGSTSKATKATLRPGDKIFYWHQTSIAGTRSARREATVLEVRSRKEAKQKGLQLVVLDNHEVLMDETVIQKFKRDKATGEWTKELEKECHQVQQHRLTSGRVEGIDPHRDKTAEAVMDKFRKKVIDFGAESQMLDFVKRGGSGADKSDSTCSSNNCRASKDREGSDGSSGTKSPGSEKLAKKRASPNSSRTPEMKYDGEVEVTDIREKPKTSRKLKGSDAGTETPRDKRRNTQTTGVDECKPKKGRKGRAAKKSARECEDGEKNSVGVSGKSTKSKADSNEGHTKRNSFKRRRVGSKLDLDTDSETDTKMDLERSSSRTPERAKGRRSLSAKKTRSSECSVASGSSGGNEGPITRKRRRDICSAVDDLADAGHGNDKEMQQKRGKNGGGGGSSQAGIVLASVERCKSVKLGEDDAGAHACESIGSPDSGDAKNSVKGASSPPHSPCDRTATHAVSGVNTTK